MLKHIHIFCLKKQAILYDFFTPKKFFNRIFYQYTTSFIQNSLWISIKSKSNFIVTKLFLMFICKIQSKIEHQVTDISPVKKDITKFLSNNATKTSPPIPYPWEFPPPINPNSFPPSIHYHGLTKRKSINLFFIGLMEVQRIVWDLNHYLV